MRQPTLAVTMAGAMLAVGLSFVGRAQELEGFSAPVKAKSFIQYAADEQTVTAGKKSVVELQFRVVDGFHVNSHRPKSELLIATQLTLEPTAGVKAGEVLYPAGKAYQLGGEKGETLDVYTGAFSVMVPVVAAVGEHTISGTLRYQACDRAACYPVKTLPVEVVVRAK